MKTCDAEEGQVAGAEVAAGGGSEAAVMEPHDGQEPAPACVGGVEALTRDLHEAHAEIRRLRAFLSHGLRQPMAALTIWAELLNAKQAAALDEQGRRYLRELTASVHRIAAMLSSEVQAASIATPEPRPSEPALSSSSPASREND